MAWDGGTFVRGKKTCNLPVETPAKWGGTINLRTAKTRDPYALALMRSLEANVTEAAKHYSWRRSCLDAVRDAASEARAF